MSDNEGSSPLDPQRYDRWFERPWGRHAFAVERAALLAALDPLEAEELLDLGCGTGRFPEAFEHAGAEVTGIDNDPGMLTHASSRTDAMLLLAHAHTLPLPDDTFDVAVAVTLLEFAEDPRRVVGRTDPGHPAGRPHRPRHPQPPQPVGSRPRRPRTAGPDPPREQKPGTPQSLHRTQGESGHRGPTTHVLTPAVASRRAPGSHVRSEVHSGHAEDRARP
jgi:hypothetical protein